MKEKNSKTQLVKAVTALAYLLMVTVNALANILPIAGVGTGEISDKYSNIFAPAGITFSIWGVIYVLLAIYTLYQIGFLQQGESREINEMTKKVSIYFMLSSFVNTGWIFAWHYEYIWLSLILMAVIFILLSMIMLEIKKHELTSKEKIYVRLPFSVYFGWITVATIANVTAFLVSVGWGGFGLSQQFWMIAIMIIGTAIAAATILSLSDFFYGLVIIWAFTGIIIKHVSSYGYYMEYPAVVVVVGLCVAAVVAAEVVMLVKRRKKA